MTDADLVRLIQGATCTLVNAAAVAVSTLFHRELCQGEARLGDAQYNCYTGWEASEASMYNVAVTIRGVTSKLAVRKTPLEMVNNMTNPDTGKSPRHL